MTRSSFTKSNSILNALSEEERKDIHRSAIESLKLRKKRQDVTSKISNLANRTSGVAALAAGVTKAEPGIGRALSQGSIGELPSQLNQLQNLQKPVTTSQTFIQVSKLPNIQQNFSPGSIPTRIQSYKIIK